MVLISTVSTFFLSSLSSSFSCLDLVHEDFTRSLRLRPLPCEQQQPHSESCKGANRRFLHAAPGSNGMLRVLRAESGRRRRPGGCSRRREGGKSCGVEALRSTGSPQTAHRSASASRDQIAEPGKPELNAEAEARRAVTGRCGSRFERCGAVQRQPG